MNEPIFIDQEWIHSFYHETKDKHVSLFHILLKQMNHTILCLLFLILIFIGFKIQKYNHRRKRDHHNDHRETQNKNKNLVLKI